MTAVYLDVFQTLAIPEGLELSIRRDRGLPEAVTMLTRLRVEADAPLSWIKAHADEIARRHLPGVAYCALNVEPVH